MIEAAAIHARKASVLLCHRHVDMALACLGSVQRLSVPSPGFRIHDDGTLTAQDNSRLLEALADTEIISRAVADERLNDEYPELKNLHGLRRRFPLIMKAFDTRVFCDEPLFASIDSDILFLRRCESPFLLPHGSINARIMQDREPSYSLRSWQMALAPKLRLPARTNSGLFVFRSEHYDIRRVEVFVGSRLHRGLEAMIEQTSTSMLAMAAGCEVYSPDQLRVMRNGENDECLLAGHFTARTRRNLALYVERSLAADHSAVPEAWRFVEHGECGVLDLLRYELRRIRTRLGLGGAA